jgi:hypothetical protein
LTCILIPRSWLDRILRLWKGRHWWGGSHIYIYIYMYIYIYIYGYPPTTDYLFINEECEPIMISESQCKSMQVCVCMCSATGNAQQRCPA